MSWLVETPEWRALVAHQTEMQDVHLRTLFASDPGRFPRLTARLGELLVDYSKHRVTDETLRLLVALADESGLRDRIDAMFRGDRINVTEDRAVLHGRVRSVSELRT